MKTLHFHSQRKRLIDVDNLSAKAVIDGLVRAGILEDDSPQFIESITHTQGKGTPEQTTITIKST